MRKEDVGELALALLLQLLVLSSSGSENEETRHCPQSSLLHSMGVNYNHTRLSNTHRLYTCWNSCTEINDPNH